MRKHFTLLLSAFLISPNVIADKYTIQVGAYRESTDHILAQAHSLGEVSTRASGTLTFVSIGKYESRDSANADLYRIQTGGFSDAFVRRIPRNAREQTASINTSKISHSHGHDSESHSHGDESHEHLPEPIQRKLDKLTDEEKKNAVILDGKLHIKRGNDFIPI